MIPSYDIDKTAQFFIGLFSFAIARKEDRYVILYKDNYLVHILPAGEDIGEMEFYLEVDAIDELWDSISDKVDGLKIKPPFDREYGMRELHVIVPHTKTLMFVGQALN